MRGSVEDWIAARSDALSPQLRRAAIYVAEHPEEVATRSLRYLAGVTELTPPTFSRLASALGFANYEELRNVCRDQIKRQRLIFAEKARALQDDDGPGARPDQGIFVVRQGSAAIDNINALLNGIDPEQLEFVADSLASARKVLLVGMMSSRPFVDYIAYMASMAFENWSVLGKGSLASALAGMGERDAALVISKAPYAKGAIEAAKHARGTGAKVFGVTDRVTSPLAAHSDINLVVSTDSPQFFSSHVATLVLIESIVGMIVARSGEAARKRIAGIEAASHALGEYWPASDL